MFSNNVISDVSSLRTSQKAQAGQKNTNENFYITLADKLLSNTRQYERWKTVMENEPSRAVKIAKLVLARHDYLTGKSAINEQGRKDFDNLTGQIKKHGIYLYNSYQFKNPVFKGAIVADQAVTETARPKPDNSIAHGCKGQNVINSTTDKNCYEFVAEILEDNGIAYYGSNGVGSALLKKAHSLRMKPNSFLTGEGITNLLCSKPVQLHVPKITSNSFNEIWDKIEPYLKKGAILSFSSQYFGHTGIIENDTGKWIYINSSGSAGNNKYRVLKEDLKHEIYSRLERARDEQTFLTITLGSVNRNLSARYGASVQTSENKSKSIDLYLAT